jgi:CheY-like chemotaxis protein
MRTAGVSIQRQALKKLAQPANFGEQKAIPGRILENNVAQILVVDDEPAVREWLVEIVAAAGHQTTTAEDGLKALNLISRQEFDLVITDIVMPNQEGFGLINEIRKTRPKLKIIVLSGRDPETLRDARLLGAHITLRKPASAQEIRRSVAELLSGEPQISHPSADLLLKSSRAGWERLQGPFVLTDEVVDAEVVPRRAGAFALGAADSSTFRVARVGRSDASINNQLHVYVGVYRSFSYLYSSTAQEAFEAECDLYHDFEPLDNVVHPSRPRGTEWKCPRCMLFA